jgi:hypothetical protein
MSESAREQYEARLKKRYLEIIENIPSISFIKFENLTDEWAIYWDGAKRISQIAMNSCDDNCINWVTNVLKNEGIKGEYRLSFGAVEPYDLLPFARIVLDDTYSWVQPLWEGRFLNLVSIDQNYVLLIQSDEECLSNNCYSAYAGRKTEGD